MEKVFLQGSFDGVLKAAGDVGADREAIVFPSLPVLSFHQLMAMEFE